MRNHQQLLIRLLSSTNSADLPVAELIETKALNSSDLSHFFVDTTFIVAAVKFIEENHWLQAQKSSQEITYSHFVKKILKFELAPILFFHSFLESSSLEELKQVGKKCLLIQKLLINQIKGFSYSEQKTFMSATLKLMSELFEFEHQQRIAKEEKGLHLGFSLYRAFDILDEVFNLNYLADEGMSLVEDGERLFANSGVGVQSSYSTMLTMLRYLTLPPKSGFVDLGSGFGRVGLTIGLMRPDIHFRGYEIVEHRVKIASQASQNFDLSSHVHFYAQDISAKDFQIPIAETYFIYDAFNESTYAHMLSQLAAIGKTKRITVVTIGDARNYFQQSSQKGLWSQPQEFDSGNFCLFRSK